MNDSGRLKKKLAELLTAYNIELKTDGTKITHVNGHVAELKGEDYMPDQLITVILQIVGADLRGAWFHALHN